MHTILGGNPLAHSPDARIKTQRVVVNIILLLLLTVSLMGYFNERSIARKLEADFGAALDAAQAGRWYWDIPDNKLMWDDNMLKIWGITRDQFNKNYDSFINNIHPDDRQAVDNAVRRSIKEKSGYRAVFRIITPDGKVVTVAAAGEVSEDGSYMTGINIPHDVIPQGFNLKQHSDG